MQHRRRMWACGVTAAIAIACSVPGSSQSPLAQQMSALTSEPAVARAHWGVMVTAMDGTPIYALNEGQFFQPASNAKLFTTTAAVHLLGPKRVFRTNLEGPLLVEGVTTMSGNLVLRGVGDANISGRAVPYVEPGDRPKGSQPKIDPLRYLAEMADGIAAAGVKRITGDIVGDDTLFPWQPYPSDWAADDLVWGYGAPVSALTINDNQIEVKVTPGGHAGAPATVTLDPAVPYYTVENTVTTVADKAQASVEMQRDLGSKVLKISGTIAVGGDDVEEVAIHDPAEYAAVALKVLLEARGIVVDGRARAQHRVIPGPSSFLHEVREPLPSLPKEALASYELLSEPLACSFVCPLQRHLSPTVIEDVTITNKNSQNLHAELLLRQLGKAYGTDGSLAEGARVVRQFLLNAGLDKDDFVFYDGSGLSGHDLVTPRATAKLLQYASTQPWFTAWKASLPVGGVDGTLSSRFTQPNLKGRVFAKTGTLGEARALSGYLECASGKTVIFTIMVGNHAPSNSADRDVMDRMVAAIATAN